MSALGSVPFSLVSHVMSGRGWRCGCGAQAVRRAAVRGVSRSVSSDAGTHQRAFVARSRVFAIPPNPSETTIDKNAQPEMMSKTVTPKFMPTPCPLHCENEMIAGHILSVAISSPG